jgi:hypothetical protein
MYVNAKCSINFSSCPTCSNSVSVLIGALRVHGTVKEVLTNGKYNNVPRLGGYDVTLSCNGVCSLDENGTIVDIVNWKC